MIAERLATRTLELVDIASESRSEEALYAYLRGALSGVQVRELGDGCLLAQPVGTQPSVLLAGHTDTVPEQGNRPGSRDAEHVHGLGASDMKGGLAVAIELVLAGLPFAALFFPREELPFNDSALTPLLEREPLAFDVAFVMEPTDCAVHAGCLGNINANWRFDGVAAHSARPWHGTNAIELAAAGVTALAAHPVERVVFDGLEFAEVASVTKINGGVAGNVIPDRVDCWVNYRYAPGRSPASAEARLAELTAGHGTLEITGHAPSGAVAVAHPLVQRLIAVGGLGVEPKQAWTPVAELAAAGLPAVNFGPGVPSMAHKREESVPIANLLRCYEVLEAFAA